MQNFLPNLPGLLRAAQLFRLRCSRHVAGRCGLIVAQPSEQVARPNKDHERSTRVAVIGFRMELIGLRREGFVQ